MGIGSSLLQGMRAVCPIPDPLRSDVLLAHGGCCQSERLRTDRRACLQLQSSFIVLALALFRRAGMGRQHPTSQGQSRRRQDSGRPLPAFAAHEAETERPRGCAATLDRWYSTISFARTGATISENRSQTEPSPVTPPGGRGIFDVGMENLRAASRLWNRPRQRSRGRLAAPRHGRWHQRLRTRQ